MDEQGPGFIPDWVQKGLLAMLATLSTIVAHFYRHIVKNYETTINELKVQVSDQQVKSAACESHRFELATKVAKLEVEVPLLREQLEEIRNNNNTV